MKNFYFQDSSAACGRGSNEKGSSKGSSCRSNERNSRGGKHIGGGGSSNRNLQHWAATQRKRNDEGRKVAKATDGRLRFEPYVDQLAHQLICKAAFLAFTLVLASLPLHCALKTYQSETKI